MANLCIFNCISLHFSIAKYTKCEIDENFFYLYSNVITTYNGNYKSLHMEQASLTNNVLEKFSEKYIQDEQLKQTVKEWERDENYILKNLAESIILKVENKNLRYEELYPVKEFKKIEDELVILGLSPFNDTHIFKYINENKKLKNITYYYYSKDEKSVVKRLLSNFEVSFIQVNNLWSEYK